MGWAIGNAGQAARNAEWTTGNARRKIGNAMRTRGVLGSGPDGQTGGFLDEQEVD